MSDTSINPETHPDQFAMFVLLTDGEVFGHMTLPIHHAASLVAGFRSPNLSVVEVEVGTQPPAMSSTWNGEEFLPPVASE